VYLNSLKQVTDELPKWESSVAPKTESLRFTKEPVEVIEGMIEQMKSVAAALGVERL
jgi:hypothetical protein